MVTVFSAPQYPAGKGTNKGAIVVLEGGSDCSYTIYQLDYTAPNQPSPLGGDADDDEEPSVYAGGQQGVGEEEAEQQQEEEENEEEEVAS